jgi:hypothetical protein
MLLATRASRSRKAACRDRSVSTVSRAKRYTLRRVSRSVAPARPKKVRPLRAEFDAWVAVQNYVCKKHIEFRQYPSSIRWRTAITPQPHAETAAGTGNTLGQDTASSSYNSPFR